MSAEDEDLRDFVDTLVVNISLDSFSTDRESIVSMTRYMLREGVFNKLHDRGDYQLLLFSRFVTGIASLLSMALSCVTTQLKDLEKIARSMVEANQSAANKIEDQARPPSTNNSASASQIYGGGNADKSIHQQADPAHGYGGVRRQ